MFLWDSPSRVYQSMEMFWYHRSSICVCIDEIMLILIWPFDSYANMCSLGRGGCHQTHSPNLIAPYYWNLFLFPCVWRKLTWYSLSRSYSNKHWEGEVSDGKGGTYSCLLLTIPYPTCEGWCQATTLVMHITEPQQQVRICLRLTCVFVAMHFKHLSCDIILFHELVYPCECWAHNPISILASKSYNTNKTNTIHVFHLQ